MIKRFTVALLTIFIATQAIAQATTGSLSGIVAASTGEKLSGAYVRLLHGPTGTAYYATSNRTGVYRFDGLLPGGPYTLHIDFIGFASAVKEALTISLGETQTLNVQLVPIMKELQQLVVTAKKKKYPAPPGAAVMNAERISMLAATGKNMSDYLQYLAGAQTLEGTEGAVSFAGQNNRYNALFIDGANSNDVFGLSAAGTNGAQAGLSPLPIESIAALQVNTTPYDASYGNFTGAVINAVTRSGSNRKQRSFYGNYSSRDISSSAGTDNYSGAENYKKIYGMRAEGPFRLNRAFYFFNMEFVREANAQLFDPAAYIGSADLNTISILANNLRSAYHYDAGQVLNSPASLHAVRAVARFDWFLHSREKLSCSIRYLDGNRDFANQSTATTIHFSRDGFNLQTRSLSASLEWVKKPGEKLNHKLLVTGTAVTDDRGPAGKPFPRVRIFDGDGSIIFGTDNSSTINLLKQKNFTAQEYLHFARGRHNFGIGMDGELNFVHNAFIQNSFGSYSYSSIADFIGNRSPSGYQSGFSLLDSVQDDRISAAAKFSVVRGGIFINDEIICSPAFRVSIGMRAEKNWFITPPASDPAMNDSVLTKLAVVYDLHGARAGNKPDIPFALSPRVSFDFQAGAKTCISGGAGLFRGKVPLAWPGGIYQFNGINTGGFVASGNQLSRIRFRANPYQQWKPWELNDVVNKAPLNLVSARLNMPSLWRSSLTFDHQFRNGWKLVATWMASRNTSVIGYKNVNLPLPVATVTGPDNRPVYIPGGRIPLTASNFNPYDYVILLYNPSGEKGFASDYTVTLRKLIAEHTVLELAYHYGHSFALQDGTSSVNSSQWRGVETVNGRNEVDLSESDFSAAHKATVFLEKKIQFRKKKGGLGFTFSYTGQSGSPFSYVYENSLLQDDGKSVTGDLLFVPTPAQLAAMIFLPATFRGLNYTPDQQRDALEAYIGQDAYLSKRRGGYAARNGSRAPFTQTVNIRLVADFRLPLSGKPHLFRFSATLYNAGNLVCNRWGLKKVIPNDQLALVEFAGFRSDWDLTPQFRFDPAKLVMPGWVTAYSAEPAYSSAWTTEFSFRITF